MKRWKINKTEENAVSQILKKTDLPPLCAEIMASRGITDLDSLSDFFNSSELSDPFDLIDMDKAVEAITRAVEEFSLICVYGDYDCDGVTATVVLYNYLDCMGANVMYYIPEREAGYGLNKDAIDLLAEQGVELIVTVDNGISAFDEAEYIYEKGMKLVVTDHHQPPENLPRAEAVVDPHRKDCPSVFKDTAGVGVALKLCAALDDGNYEMVMEQYADLAAIGTVADIVPLKSENRTIVSQGIELIKNTENYGINHLMEKCSISPEEFSSTSIAFGIAPRINAAGRFGSPIYAVKALLEEGEDSEIQVEKLINLNNQRKQAEMEILKSIKDFIAENPQELNKRVLVICGHGWHHGVIGIVSSKILDLYGKPNFIISVDDNGEARGSARSIKGFHIHKCLTYCDEVLEKYGGHECAGGLSLKEENLPRFCELVQRYAAENNAQMPVATITADKILRGRDLTINAIDSLDMLEPFGEGNPRPVFAVVGAKLLRVISLSQGRYTKLELEYDGAKFPALLFSVSPDDFPFKNGELLDMMVSVETNSYNNSKSLSVKVVDFRLHGVKQEPYFAAKACYESFMLGETLPQNFINKIVPDRSELVELYKYISAVKRIGLDILYMRFEGKMNYCKLRLCIDVLCEIDLLSFNAVSGEVFFRNVTERKDLSDSGLFVRLRKMVEG